MAGELSDGRTWALHPSDDARARRAAVTVAHTSFLEHAQRVNARAVVLESWRRSKHSGVDPDLGAVPTALTGTALDDYRATHPTALIRPMLDALLVPDAADAGLIVAVSDAGGKLLWVDGDRAAQQRAARMNFAPGADWSEQTVGTNAPGTALAIDRPVQIFTAEHFSRVVQPWSCTAAPLHDPRSGRILGAVDVTGGPRVALPEILALVKTAVAAVEAQLRIRLLEQPNLLDVGTARVELLGARPVLVRDGERIALTRRQAEILLLLREFPEGLTADELTVLLDESDIDAVTVRAEISRLRRAIGAGLLASRPYRVSDRLRTDVDDVRDALARHDVHHALELYSVPVLAHSHAPGVYRIREELRAQVRRSVLRTRERSALARWTASVEGREDLQAWRAYRAALGPHAPNLDQVEARIERLDRELGIPT